jgi:hypothetical protein
VRVVRGLRKSAGMTHKSMGRVKFKVHKAGDKNDDGLAAAYPRGVACFMKDFISGHHHAMAHRTRTAPAGYGEDTIASRREGIETGSERSLIEARIEATSNAIYDQYDQLDDTIYEMHRAGNPNSTAHLRTELRGASPIIAGLQEDLHAANALLHAQTARRLRALQPVPAR